MNNALIGFTEAGRLVGMRLCNFSTGSAELLPAHVRWIDEHFLPKIQLHPYAWVDLIGSASRVGTAQNNLRLSERRIAAVETYLKSRHPALKFNLRLPQGEAIATSHNYPESNDEGFWRAVLIRWYGLPLQIPGPAPEPPGLKLRSYSAPKGCWCITGVDSFGVSVGPVAGGRVVLTLLNDRGEKWLLTGVGLGGGAGVEVGPKQANKAVETMVNTLVGLGLKPGDLQNVAKTIKDLNLTGPSETNGGIFKRLTWSADLTLAEITASGFFTIASGEFHLLIGGGELGLIVFCRPVIEPAWVLTRPWGFFGSAGLVTWKAAAGLSMVVYRIISTERQLQPTSL